MALKLFDFIKINPAASGPGHMNVMYSGSVAPFDIVAVTIPLESKNGVDLRTTMREAEELIFDINGTLLTVNITDIILQGDFYSIVFPVQQVDSLPPDIYNEYIGETLPGTIDSETVINPYTRVSFRNNDYNPLISNANNLRTSQHIQQVDRLADKVIPTNYQAIISSSATPAKVQDSNYHLTGWINARYRGTKLTSGSVEGNNPALSLINFEGSLHASGSTLSVVSAIQLSDRDVYNIYFNSPQHKDAKFPLTSYASENKILYQAIGNKFVRIVGQAVYGIDNGKMYTTDKLGKVIQVV